MIMNNRNHHRSEQDPFSSSIGSLDKIILSSADTNSSEQGGLKIESATFDWDRADLTIMEQEKESITKTTATKQESNKWTASSGIHQTTADTEEPYEEEPHKSTPSATDRPANIQPRITHTFPNELGWDEHDVPLGRAQNVREHIGNVRFRALIEQYRPQYLQAAHRSEKSHISGIIYKIITQKGGRFLDKQVVAEQGDGKPSNEQYVEIPQDKALAKISQSLRTGTRPVRRHMQELFRQQEMERLKEVEGGTTHSSSFSRENKTTLGDHTRAATAAPATGGMSLTAMVTQQETSETQQKMAQAQTTMNQVGIVQHEETTNRPLDGQEQSSSRQNIGQDNEEDNTKDSPQDQQQTSSNSKDWWTFDHSLQL